MTTIARKSTLTVSSVFTLIAVFALSATAAQPNALLLNPNPYPHLPKFGFSSFNIHGVGERVTNVRWGGLAHRLGLEPGDTILSMNGYRLNYHGSWNDALHEAMYSGGWVQLRIRDVRTGRIAYRETRLGSSGPIVGPITPKMHHHHVAHPVSPITPKKSNDLDKTIKKIANLFD